MLCIFLCVKSIRSFACPYLIHLNLICNMRANVLLLSSKLRFSASNILGKFWGYSTMADFLLVFVRRRKERCGSGPHLQTVPSASALLIPTSPCHTMLSFSSHCWYIGANGKVFQVLLQPFENSHVSTANAKDPLRISLCVTSIWLFFYFENVLNSQEEK